MLGKTNITTLSEGTVATEIEDFNWIRMQSGINGNFVKAIYENGYLAAITADGKVAYTTDGEAWQVSALEYTDCKLNDIAWDGSRFLLVGSYKDTYELGFILATNDFASYEYFSEDFRDISSGNVYNYCSGYLAVYPVNGKWAVLAINRWKGSAANAAVVTTLILLVGGMDSPLKSYNTIFEVTGDIFVGKNSQGMLVTFSYGEKGDIYLIDGNTLKSEKVKTLFNATRNSMGFLPAFECKDELYYMSANSEQGYIFAKILSSGEEMIQSNNINYGFKDGIYFNEYRLFINNHEMLILKKGESITDKSLEDLIEIVPESTMTCITKAFAQLFIFGNQGLILRSSTEGGSEEAVLLQTISAKKALLDAKAYADQQYRLLEARIAALEAGAAGEVTG